MNIIIINCSQFGPDLPRLREIEYIDGNKYKKPFFRRNKGIIHTLEEAIIINKTILYVGCSLNNVHDHDRFCNIAGYKYELLVYYDIELNIISTFIILKKCNKLYLLLPFNIVDGIAIIFHKICMFEKENNIITDFINNDPDSTAKIITFNIGYSECIAVDENKNIWVFNWNDFEIPNIRKMILPYYSKIKRIIFSAADSSSVFIFDNDIVVFNKHYSKTAYGIMSEKVREFNVSNILKNNNYYNFIFNTAKNNELSEKITSIDYSIIDSLMKITILGKINIFIIKYIMVSLFEYTDSFIKLLTILIDDYLEKLK